MCLNHIQRSLQKMCVYITMNISHWSVIRIFYSLISASASISCMGLALITSTISLMSVHHPQSGLSMSLYKQKKTSQGEWNVAEKQAAGRKHRGINSTDGQRVKMRLTLALEVIRLISGLCGFLLVTHSQSAPQSSIHLLQQCASSAKSSAPPGLHEICIEVWIGPRSTAHRAAISSWQTADSPAHAPVAVCVFAIYSITYLWSKYRV